MVTFRFYVVSTVAFFLALSVGVVVGSVLDGRIADSLQDRLDGVEQSLDETVASIDAKSDAIAQMQRYMDDSAPFAVQGRLDGTTTLVAVETGVGTDVAEDLVLRLQQAGSRVEGIVWLDRRLDLADEEDRRLAAGLVGLPESDDPDVIRAALWASVVANSGSGVEAGAKGTTTTTPEPSPPNGAVRPTTTSTTPASTTTAPARDQGTSEVPLDLLFEQSPLAELAEAGLVRFQAIDGGAAEVVATELLVATLSGPDSTLADPGLVSGEIAAGAASAGVPTVLGGAVARSLTPEAAMNADRAGLLPAPDLEDNTSISTVNDLEWVAGRVATALALADLREGRSGRYGLGSDVDGLLPPWQGP
ncbi:MAG: copper transporter [Microthrixaceae bacterium]|nr:copper transporter [Microthrixaceae bacterium]